MKTTNKTSSQPSQMISVEKVTPKPYNVPPLWVQRAQQQIMAAEDARIFEILESIVHHTSEDGDGMCTKCGLPFDKDPICAIYEVGSVMDS